MKARPSDGGALNGSLLTRNRWSEFAILSFAAVVGGSIIYYGTRWGPWAYSDSVGYIVSARSLLVGRGLGLLRPSGEFVNLVIVPPLYPLLIAALGGAGVGLVNAARWLDIFFFACFLCASAVGAYRITRSGWIAAGVTAVFLAQPAILLAYLSAMSEPVFMFFLVASLVLVAIFITDGRRKVLILSAFAAMLALLTRYAGIALIISCSIGILALTRSSLRRRLEDVTMFGACSVGPTAAFVLWSHLRLHSTSPRALSQNIQVGSLVTDFTSRAVSAIWTWKPIPPNVIPNNLISSHYTMYVAGSMASALAIAIAWSVASSIHARRRSNIRIQTQVEWRPAALLGIFLATFVLFYASVYLVTYPAPDVDSRELLPLLPVGLLLVFVVSDLGLRLTGGPTLLRASLVTAVALSVVGYSLISADMVTGMHRTGLGYTSRAWQSSQTLAAVQRLPPELSLITNETAAIMLYTDRSAHEIPGLQPSDPRTMSVPFGSGSSELDQEYRSGKAALILFNSINRQLKNGPKNVQKLTPSDLTAGLHAAYLGNDGSIYCRCTLTER